MLRTQRWVPDTHAAEFDCRWDDEDPDAPHVCIRAVVDGVEQKDPQSAYERVLGQNQAKNIALAEVCALLPADMLKPVRDDDGEETGEFAPKGRHAPTGSVNAKGQVVIMVPGLSEAKAGELTAATAEHVTVQGE